MLGWGRKCRSMIPEIRLFSHVICGLLVWLLEKKKGYTIKQKICSWEVFLSAQPMQRSQLYILIVGNLPPGLFRWRNLVLFFLLRFLGWVSTVRGGKVLFIFTAIKNGNINIHFASTKWMFLITFNQALRVQGTSEHMTQQSKQKTQSTSLGCVDINTTRNLRFYSFYNCCNSTKYQSSQADTCWDFSVHMMMDGWIDRWWMDGNEAAVTSLITDIYVSYWISTSSSSNTGLLILAEPGWSEPASNRGNHSVGPSSPVIPLIKSKLASQILLRMM